MGGRGVRHLLEKTSMWGGAGEDGGASLGSCPCSDARTCEGVRGSLVMLWHPLSPCLDAGWGEGGWWAALLLEAASVVAAAAAAATAAATAAAGNGGSVSAATSAVTFAGAAV